MPSNDAIGSKHADKADWNSAWEIVSRLAAARETAMHDVGAAAPAAVVLQAAASGSPAATPPPAAADPDQLTRAIVEIEQASAALRRSEPALEAGLPRAPTRPDTRKYVSVWILIGGIWISASLMLAGATGAIMYLLG